MYQEKGFKTIFDDVKAKPILSANIKEDEVIKPTKSFSVNNDKFDYSLIVDEYKMPSFQYISDNSINDFYDYPDVTMSQNPEYKYKYPKLSTAETIKQQWQTEEGTPNELNRFLRHNEKGDSLDDIQEQDDVYQQGLKQIENLIKDRKSEAYEQIVEAEKMLRQPNVVMTKEQKSKEEANIKDAKKDLDEYAKNLNDKMTKRYKKTNPVLIKPAINPELKSKFKSAFLAKGRRPPVSKYEPEPPSDDAINEKLPIKPEGFKLKAKAIRAVTPLPTPPAPPIKKEELDDRRKARYETLNKQYNDQSKKIVAEEKLVLQGYDEVLNKLKNITSKRLTGNERKEVNKMLKEIDGSNIGAIALKRSAIDKLLTKKELIENKKNVINAKKKAEAVEKKAPRKVSANPNIKQFSNLSHGFGMFREVLEGAK